MARAAGDYEGETGGISDAPPAPRGGAGGASGVGDVATLLQQRREALGNLAAIQRLVNDDPTSLVDPAKAGAYKAAIEAASSGTLELLRRKLDPNTGEAIPDTDASTAIGNLSARLQELGITARHYERSDAVAETNAQTAKDQNRIAEEGNIRTDARMQRETNIDTILKDLEGKIQAGTLSRQAALDKANTEISAADQRRRVITDFGGKALPAGTQFFPGLEPNSAAGNAVRALGFEFPGMATGGTWSLDPSSFSQPAIDAINAPNPAINAATAAAANAAKLLAGLGVPMGVA